jgi:hypothetical protein
MMYRWIWRSSVIAAKEAVSSFSLHDEEAEMPLDI